MKTITIQSQGLGRYDDVSPFLVERGDLELKVILPDIAGEFYLVTELNGAVGKYFIPREGTVVLKDISAGELHAEVKHYLKGILIRKYKVESLILREVYGAISATPELVELEGKIKALFSELHDLKEELKERKAAEEALERRIGNIENGYDPLRG